MNFCTFAACAVVAVSSIVIAQPITDSFTYQGALMDEGVPANGFYDMNFFIYDSAVGGTLVPGGINFSFNVEVIDGLFETFVEFNATGSVFDSDQTRWLQLSVSEVGQPGSTVLAPRQRITPAPLANYALRSGTTLQAAYDNGSTIFRGVGDPAVDIRSSGADPARLSLGSPLGGEPQGQFYMYGPNGGNMFRVEQDFSAGGGGFLNLGRNNAGSNGFVVDGNTAGTESTQVTITGASSSIILSTRLTDDLSVQLPNNAINATEILNETGVTDTSISAAVLLTNDPATIDVVASVTIDCPAAGYVFVIVSAELTIIHATGVSSNVLLGVSESTNAFPSNGGLLTRVDTFESSGLYGNTVTAHSVFPAIAGSNTFYFLGDKNHVGGSTRVSNTQLSAIFIPTEYGSGVLRQANPNLPDGLTPVSGPMTNYDIVMEQNAAIIANNQRLEREVAAMKAQMQQILEQTQQTLEQQRQD